MSKVECGKMFETVENLCDVIAPLRIEVWTSAEPLPFARRFEGEYRKLEVGESWGGLFDCGWFRFSGTVPEGEKLCDLALRLDVNGELLIVDAQGRLDFDPKMNPADAPQGCIPWFDYPRKIHKRICFGHWSTLGLLVRPDVIAIDTGCLWGGALTAIRLRDGRIFTEQCPQWAPPGC